MSPEAFLTRGFLPIPALGAERIEPSASHRCSSTSIRTSPLFAGVELNEQAIRVIITDFKGEILCEDRSPIRSSFDTLPDDLTKTITALVKQTGKKDVPLKGIGLGVSGLISKEDGKIIQGFLPQGYDLPRLLGGPLGVPVFVENDANMAVFAERMFGDGKRHENLVCLLDRGWMGSGLFMNNQLYRGNNNAAGELMAWPDPPPDSRSELKRAPFKESFSIERAMEDTGYSAVVRSGFQFRDDMLAELSRRAMADDKKACDLIETETSKFALALLRLSALLDPGLLVVAGDIAAAGGPAEEKIRKRLSDLHVNQHFGPPEFYFSSLGRNAVTLGAAAFAVKAITNSIIQ